MARDCYSRQKDSTTLKQHQQSATPLDEATLKFSQFALHASTVSNPSTTTVGEDIQEDSDSNNGQERDAPNPTTARYIPFTEESDQDTEMDSNEEGDDEENNEAETDSKNGGEESDDNDLIRYMSDTSDELLKVQESSDINNNNTEKKSQIEGILNKYGWRPTTMYKAINMG